jgi:colanic acid biosynthesis glycosyl transferase WcaI
MRVLILHMRFHPDLTGTGPLVTNLATDLVKLGDEVTVVASMPHYGRKEVDDSYRGGIIRRENFEGVDLLRTFVYVPPNHGGFHRSLNYLSYTFMSVVAGAFAGQYDVILCVNPPITIGFSGWLVHLVRFTPMVLNIQDIWPDCIMIVNQLRNPVLIRVFKYLETFLYRVAARVTVLSPGMQANLEAKGVNSDKISIIPNWADVAFIRPVAKENPFRAAHNLNGRFVVQFAGNIGFNAMLENVLDAAQLLQNDARILFQIIGEGNAKPALVAKAESMGLANVSFLPTQPKADLPQMLGSADLSLVTLNRHLGQLNVPSKTYSIMASARPVLAAVPQDSEIASIVRKADCGVWSPPENPQAMAATIRELVDQRQRLETYGTNGREYVVRQNSRPQIVKRHRQLLAEVAQVE